MHNRHTHLHTHLAQCVLLSVVIMAVERSSLFITEMLWQFVGGLNIKQERLCRRTAGWGKTQQVTVANVVLCGKWCV